MADTNKMTLGIQIDDGSKRVPITNLHGEEIGVFYFRPTDIGMINRYNEVIQRFDDITGPLQNIGINADGTASSDADMEALNTAEKKLFEACDYMLGGNLSEAFFGSMHPFSPIGGYFYCETVLEKVGQFISAQFEEETRKINKRLRKYTAGYKK